MSAVSYLRSRLESLELEKQQIIKVLEEFELFVHQPLAAGQMVSFKNLGSNEFMNDTRQTLASSKEFSVKFLLSEYSPNVFIVNSDDGINVLDFAYGRMRQDIYLFKKHFGFSQCWTFEKTPQGTIIHSCRGREELILVLIQKGDVYTCVEWADIKDTEQEKFAYWQIIN